METVVMEMTEIAVTETTEPVATETTEYVYRWHGTVSEISLDGVESY
jgi:hypothetical protein